MVNCVYLVISRGFLETGTENILALFGMGGLGGGGAVTRHSMKVAVLITLVRSRRQRPLLS